MDKFFFPRKFVRYEGNHPDLVSGESYPYQAYAKICNILPNSFKNRLGKRTVVTDDLLFQNGFISQEKRKRPRPKTSSEFVRLESEIDKLSNQWLRRKLVNG